MFKSKKAKGKAKIINSFKVYLGDSKRKKEKWIKVDKSKKLLVSRILFAEIFPFFLHRKM